MIKLNDNLLKGKWLKYDDGVEFKVKPYDQSTIDLNSEDNNYFRDKKLECVLDWKGVVDGNENPLKFNEINRALLFGNNAELITWLLESLAKLNDELVGVLKN